MYTRNSRESKIRFEDSSVDTSLPFILREHVEYCSDSVVGGCPYLLMAPDNSMLDDDDMKCLFSNCRSAD